MKFDILFIKFILVGILNTLFGYGIFSLLLFSGLHYSLSVILGTVAAVLFNFKTTGMLVFKNNDNRLIFRFVTVYGIICFINIALLRFAELLRINLYLAGFVVTGFMAVVSFVLIKNWVFKG